MGVEVGRATRGGKRDIYIKKIYLKIIVDIFDNIKSTSLVEDPIKAYHECTAHIALERSDTYKDWRVFRFILNIDRDFLLWHLEMTKEVF